MKILILLIILLKADVKYYVAEFNSLIECREALNIELEYLKTINATIIRSECFEAGVKV